jgi:hypothetical protein
VRDGANWFAYVNNDPVNWVDPWGLSASDKGLPNNINTVAAILDTAYAFAGASVQQAGASKTIVSLGASGGVNGFANTLPDTTIINQGKALGTVGAVVAGIVVVADAVITGINTGDVGHAIFTGVGNILSAATSFAVGAAVTGVLAAPTMGVSIVPATMIGAAVGTAAGIAVSTGIDWLENKWFENKKSVP